jgi:hypothetical protein
MRLTCRANQADAGVHPCAQIARYQVAVAVPALDDTQRLPGIVLVVGASVALHEGVSDVVKANARPPAGALAGVAEQQVARDDLLLATASVDATLSVVRTDVVR